jgi:hypothetical protein
MWPDRARVRQNQPGMNIRSKHELEVKRQKGEEEAQARGRYLSAEDRFASRRCRRWRLDRGPHR